jgi:hypothetical protein
MATVTQRLLRLEGQLAVVGPELVRSCCQQLLSPHGRLLEQDAELLVQLFEEEAVEEGFILLPSGTKVYRQRQQLLGSQWKHTIKKGSRVSRLQPGCH